MDIILYNFRQYEVRATVIDGEYWFIGKDVAEALEYKRPNDAVAQHVDEEDKKSTTVKHRNASGGSKTTIINESGLYSLTLSSKKESAKPFKRWITSDLLPTLRKTGRYEIKPAEPKHNIPQTYAAALRAAANEADRADEAERKLEYKTKQLEAAQPAVEFVQRSVNTEGTFSFDEAAKMLGLKNPEGKVIGRNLLIQGLHEMGVLTKTGRHNVPMQEHIKAGRFVVKYSLYDDGYGSEFSTPMTRVTSKGVYWIRQKCIAAGCRPFTESVQFTMALYPAPQSPHPD